MTTVERLRSMRKRARLTQAQLADRLGVAQSWVSDRERGERHLLVDDLLEWADACAVPLTIVELPDASPDELPDLLRATSPQDLGLVLQLLQALPVSSAETRSTIEAILTLAQERAKAHPGSQRHG